MKSNLRLCSLAPFPPKESGIADYSSYLHKELKNLTDISLLVWNYPKPILTFAPILFFRRLRKACLANDIIHVQYALGDFMPLFLPFLWLARVNTKCKIIFTLHEEYDNVPLSWFVRRYHDFWYLIADRLFVHSPQHKQRLPSWLQKRAVVIPHGIIYRENPYRQPIQNTILLPGFINNWKGHDVAIKALAKVKKQIPCVKLLIVGKPHDKEFTESMHELSTELNLENNIIWDSGFVPKEKFFEYYRTSAISILPYHRITMSGILCHILSWQIPTIASNLSIFKWFTDNRALYFKDGSVDELSREIIRLLKSQKLKQKISSDFKSLSEKYSWESTAKKTLQEYHSLFR